LQPLIDLDKLPICPNTLSQNSRMTEILIFDVNETLLDLRALRPHFERAFDDGRVMEEWFSLMLRLSLVATVTRSYRPFDVLGKDALVMTAQKHGVDLDSASIETILCDMLRMPPHSDAIPGLTRLQDAGFRMATLANSTPPSLAAQLVNAGLEKFFERQLSVEAVQLYKPAPETYQYAADQLGVSIGDIRLVAAHDWDVTGAIRAGAKAAFVARKGMVLGESAAIPDIIGPDLLAIADHLQP
jgi:2-haloacid dehalogenase